MGVGGDDSWSPSTHKAFLIEEKCYRYSVTFCAKVWCTFRKRNEPVERYYSTGNEVELNLAIDEMHTHKKAATLL